jgi:hypothetical protein
MKVLCGKAKKQQFIAKLVIKQYTQSLHHNFA